MKITKQPISHKPMKFVDDGNIYDYYIAIDWSSTIMSIGWIRNNSINPVVKRDLPAKLKVIKDNLKELKGKKILTIEETTGAQWLYVELKDYVDKIIICNPYRNALLKDGPKNDPKDAGDLCRLLRSGLLKEVYHSTDENYKIRKFFSAYNDLVKAGVRAKNQLSAIYRSYGLNHKKDKLNIKDDPYINFMIEDKLKAISLYTEEKKKYEKLFREIMKSNKTIKNLKAVRGIGLINAVKIFSVVIDATRFETKYQYWAYCGLVKYKMESGQRNYGKKNTQYSRMLKEAYKTAVLAALWGKNDINEYYHSLLAEGYPEKLAMNQICRYISLSTLAMMKHGTEYKLYNWRKQRAN
jgi:transposase